MGFISTIQHNGRLFIAGQPRRTIVQSTALFAPDDETAANQDGWLTAWAQMQVVASTLWQSARRNVLAAVERVGPDLTASNVQPGGAPAKVRPLRVVHVVDASGGRGTGRMVISGRMADVCAELERLAACEARHARC